MKSLFSITAALIVCTQVASATSLHPDTFGERMETGSFQMFNSRNPNLNCSIGMNLILDKAQVTGNIALMEDFVAGNCEIAAVPNPRFMKVTDVVDDGCGSNIISGKLYQGFVVSSVEIVDNRERTCDNVIPALIVMKIKNHTTGEEKRLYSNDRK